MTSFDIDKLLNIRAMPVKLGIEEFLDNIMDGELRARVISLFDPYGEIIWNINITNSIEPLHSCPEIFVHIDSTLEPQTVFGGIIEMSDAFIMRCLELDVPNFKEVVDDYPDDLNVEELAPRVSMMWTYCHEYFHYVRKHEEVKNILREQEGEGFDEQMTDYALERDADLCGISMVFDYMYHIHQGLMPELMIRQLTLFLVFWRIRPQLHLEHGQRHLSMGSRLANIASKLAMLNEKGDRSGKVDRDFKEEATKKRHDKLMDCLFNCERVYLERYDQTDGLASLQNFFEWEGDNPMLVEVARRWDEMRSLVMEISGTPA